jgi:hypothetical protein
MSFLVEPFIRKENALYYKDSFWNDAGALIFLFKFVFFIISWGGIIACMIYIYDPEMYGKSHFFKSEDFTTIPTILIVYLICHLRVSLYVNYYGVFYNLLNLGAIFLCFLLVYELSDFSFVKKLLYYGIPLKVIINIYFSFALFAWFYLAYYLFGAPDGQIIEENENSITIIIPDIEWGKFFTIDGRHYFTFDSTSSTYEGANTWYYTISFTDYERDGKHITSNKKTDQFKVFIEIDRNFKYDSERIQK